MKTVGLITEYNPFHNGHLYHLNQAKINTKADYVVVVMSGNFLQRGVPALIEKKERTLMALQNGADLVLELPTPYATGSAEYFALGAVSTLDRLGVIDSLCFGSECNDITLLQEIASLVSEETSSYQEMLRLALKNGDSFPAARERAISYALPAHKKALIQSIISNPNTILGIEYCKAIQKLSSSIQPVALQRIISGYHDETIHHTICSATAIRQVLLSQHSLESFKNQVPPNVFDLLVKTLNDTFPIDNNDFSVMLKYCLLSKKNDDFSEYLDVSSDLSDRIKNYLDQFTSFDDFAKLLKNKQYTLTRIHRALIHILLNIKQTDMDIYLDNGISHYARILGFRKSSAHLLSEIKKKGSLPMISKLADAKQLLSPLGQHMLEQDIFASDLYHTIVTDKFGAPLRNEYTKGIVLID